MEEFQQSADHSKSGIKSFLTYRLSTIHYNLDSHAEATLSKHSSLSLLEWRILSIINHDVTTTLPAVIKISCLDEADVSREMQSLMQKEYVVSTQSDTADDRDHTEMFSLSQAGRDLHNNVLGHMVIRQTRLVEQLTTQEMKALDTILTKLNDAALEMRRSVC